MTQVTPLDLSRARADLAVRSRERHGVLVVWLAGEVSPGNEHWLIPGLRRALAEAGEVVRGVVLALQELTSCSRHGVGVLADVTASLSHSGTPVGVVGLGPHVSRMWLETDLPVPPQYATTERAVKALSLHPLRSMGTASTATATTAASPAGSAATAAESTDALRHELAGLRRAMVHRATIEQAKGMLMGTTSCTADEAFRLLAEESQRSNRKLSDIAADLVSPRPA